jgi:hypothetical protein
MARQIRKVLGFVSAVLTSSRASGPLFAPTALRRVTSPSAVLWVSLLFKFKDPSGDAVPHVPDKIFHVRQYVGVALSIRECHTRRQNQLATASRVGVAVKGIPRYTPCISLFYPNLEKLPNYLWFSLASQQLSSIICT